MNTSRIKLYLLPEEFWQKRDDPLSDISVFVRDALAIERRIKKGVNLVNERMRYQLCCRRIQSAVARYHDEGLETEILDDGYIAFLRFLYADAKTCECASLSRISANFFPPERVEEQIIFFKNIVHTITALDGDVNISKRVTFFEKAKARGAGIVEVQEFYVSDENKQAELSNLPIRQMKASVTIEEDTLSQEQRGNMLKALNAQIDNAIQTGGEVNFSNQPHSVITEALNFHVYRNGVNQDEKSVKVVYMDGSEAERFPLHCLETSENKDISEQDTRILKVSLISMRHLAMDDHVDMAWFRNCEVSVARPFAETDAFCARRTIELLKEIENRDFCIHLYQTGLEPAVVGFYRGLVRFLHSQEKRCLRVIPFYKKAGQYEEGTPWT